MGACAAAVPASRARETAGVSVGTHCTRAPAGAFPKPSFDGGLPVPLFTKHLHRFSAYARAALFLFSTICWRSLVAASMLPALASPSASKQRASRPAWIGTRFGKQTMRSG